MKLLALESANEQCSVAIMAEQGLLFQAVDTRAKAQTMSILPLVQQALQHCDLQLSDLNAIAFSRGPGSFSGVRINAAVAQGLAWAHDLPVIAVSTLQALAQAAYSLEPQHEYTAVLDARMNEVYIGHFVADAQGIMQLQCDELLLSYAAANDYIEQLGVQKLCNTRLVGSGAALLGAEWAKLQQTVHASAVQIAQIAYPLAVAGLGVAAELALPVYLRDNAWKKIAEQGKAHA